MYPLSYRSPEARSLSSLGFALDVTVLLHQRVRRAKIGPDVQAVDDPEGNERK